MPVLWLAAATLLTVQAPAADDWRPLFNGRDLDGWYTFLQEHGKDHDPDRVITIENGAIRLYQHARDGDRVVMGYIGTVEEFGDFHLRLKFRWGQKKFAPRYDLKRDAGVYYHISGPDAVWPRSLQFQVQETDVGDLLALYGMQLDTWIDPESRDMEIPTFLDADAGGEPFVLGGRGIGYLKRLPGRFEKEGWNTIEILAQGDSTTHILNGQVVARSANVRVREPEGDGPARPIRRGRIALEIEAAEIDFRDVEIRRLDRAEAAPR